MPDQEPLTGDQVFFIRHAISLTGLELANALGVTQAAISKWENKREKIAKIEPAIEFCLRLVALEHLNEGGIDDLQKLFFKNHCLSVMKQKQKNADFIPMPLQIEDGELYDLRKCA